jgi:predicted nucleotidyltransferase
VQRTSVEALIQALNAGGVRYLIVGGLAVVAHGYVRFTADVDVVLDLDGDNPRRALTALTGLGYRPRAPVALDEFADADRRDLWVREKGLTVFSLYSPEHLATEVDLFVQSPFDFTEAYGRAARIEVAPGVAATFVGLEDLIVLKQHAGRPQDALDVQQLNALRKDRPDDA